MWEVTRAFYGNKRTPQNWLYFGQARRKFFFPHFSSSE